jgi:hypothetical protein
MSDNLPPVADGAGASGNEPKDNPPAPKDDAVPYDKYRGLLDEKKKAQKRAEEAEARLLKIEEDKLAASGEIQKILDAEKAKNQALAEKVNSLENVQRSARKLNAFIKAAGPGLDPKWYNLVNLDKIAFMDGSDDIDPATVASELDVFKKTWSEAFVKPGSMPPANPPNGGSGKISQAEFNKLPSKEMKKYRPEDIL